MYYIGLMSGTSADGIDASIIETNGKHSVRPIADFAFSYPEEVRNNILNILSLPFKEIPYIANEITKLHAVAVEGVITKSGIDRSQIKAIGFHGQTIWHDPANLVTWQIGNPAQLAYDTGLKVVADFRSFDVAAGGNGAPLVPIYHQAIIPQSEQPSIVINIGGVSNITFISEEKIAAFDTGPGNGLIDIVMQQKFNKKFDEDGNVAKSGKVDQNLLSIMLGDEYFKVKYTKSLDRLHFVKYLNEIKSLKAEDQVATLSEFTVQAIMQGLKLLPKNIKSAYICGGGFKNAYISERLAEELSKAGTAVKQLLELGFDTDFIESQAFAYLAARVLHNLPISFQSTTGIKSEIKPICAVYDGSNL